MSARRRISIVRDIEIIGGPQDGLILRARVCGRTVDFLDERPVRGFLALKWAGGDNNRVLLHRDWMRSEDLPS